MMQPLDRMASHDGGAPAGPRFISKFEVHHPGITTSKLSNLAQASPEPANHGDITSITSSRP
jgi:hypothetical protein